MDDRAQPKQRVQNRVNDALRLIEERLADTLTLEDIAAAAHFSTYHFARLFRLQFNDSVMRYVRGRRLSRAVDLLGSTTEPILTIALECGFASNETLTRTFRKQFGISPSVYRRNALRLTLPTQRRLVMSETTEQLDLQPTFEKRDAFSVVGCADEFLPGATQDIGELWTRFVPRAPELEHRIDGATYGVCCLPGEGPKNPESFTYVAGVEVENLEKIPEGMIGVELPAREYAVFAYTGGIGPELPKTMQYIFGQWLPESDYEADGSDFEYYDDRFDPVTGQGTFFIYVPVKARN